MKDILVKCWITAAKYEEDTNSRYTLKNTYAEYNKLYLLKIKKPKQNARRYCTVIAK